MEFKKGDYIVVLEDSAKIVNWKNFIFKQAKNYPAIYPELHIDGTENKDSSYSDFSTIDDVWRYATTAEILEYERLGRPYSIEKFDKNSVKNENYTYLIPILEKLS